MMLREFPHRKDDVMVSVFGVSALSAVDGPGKRCVVFFQGCNQRCTWCHSPHSQPKHAPLLFRAKNCSNCKRCLEVCPNNVHSFIDGEHSVDRTFCILCGACVDACPNSSKYSESGILNLPTKKISVTSLFIQMQPYLDIADGITLSGGEALLQDGAVEFLRLCKENGIHTCVETSGLLSGMRYDTALPFVDMWLFDVRVVTDNTLNFNSEKLITNVKILKKNSACSILPVIPLIPEVMNTQEVLREIKLLLTEIGAVEIKINPWNRFYDVYYEISGSKLIFNMPSEMEIERCENEVLDFLTKEGYKIL